MVGAQQCRVVKVFSKVNEVGWCALEKSRLSPFLLESSEFRQFTANLKFQLRQSLGVRMHVSSA